MKIVQIPRRFIKEEWGGTETVVLETTRRLNILGHQSYVATTMALANKRKSQIQGVEILRFPYFYPYLGLSPENSLSLDKKGGNLVSFPLFRHLLRTTDLDLIHLHTGKRLGGIARTAAYLKKIPYVISLHGGILNVPQEEANTWINPTQGCFEYGKLFGAIFGSRRVLEDASAIICVNKEESENLQKIYPHKRVYFLPNGVDTSKFSDDSNSNLFRQKNGISQDSFLILCCSRIDPQKNQLFLVDQLPQMLKLNNKIELAFLGPTTNAAYEKKLIESCEKNGVSNRVHFIGGRSPGHPDIVAAYKASDLFVLPSVHEPFGIVILEAWAAKLPVIASRVGGIPHFTQNQTNILHFDPNSSEEFMKQFIEIHNSPNLRKTIAQNGYLKAAQEYDWGIITQKLLSIYSSARGKE